MTHRFFRADRSTYASILDGINASWGLPANGQQTAFAMPDDAPADSQGRLYLAVWDFFCEYEAVAAVLPGLLEAGLVEEITGEQYAAVLPGQ
jgi:hypothetical protein